MHGSHGHSDATADAGDRKVLWAVLVNILLTVAQIIGGLAAGSLSLIADALHNLSDAASLVIAFLARRIARRPADDKMTFGYARAEIVAALINYTTLILIGLYLLYEAVHRFFEPTPVTGWLIVIVASVALVVDLVTALLTYRLSKESINIRAAFLHNVADALGSVGVILAGTLILLFGWYIVDPIVSVLIAGYILWHAFAEIGGTIRLLMLGTPSDIAPRELIEALCEIEGVEDIHHVHVWAIHEHSTALEAHVVIADDCPGERSEAVKVRIKTLARERFGIGHTTLELEYAHCSCEGQAAQRIGHPIVAPGRSRGHHHHDHGRHDHHHPAHRGDHHPAGHLA